MFQLSKVNGDMDGSQYGAQLSGRLLTVVEGKLCPKRVSFLKSSDHLYGESYSIRFIIGPYSCKNAIIINPKALFRGPRGQNGSNLLELHFHPPNSGPGQPKFHLHYFPVLVFICSSFVVRSLLF